MPETVARGDDEGATIKSSDKRRHLLQPVIDGLAKAVARTGIHPDLLTLLSLLVALAGAWLIVMGDWVVAPFVFLLAGAFDFLDGAVARRTGKASAAGGYLDSLVDRYVDFLLLFAIMLSVDEWAMWVAGSVALFGVLMTSAARWRVHEDHHPTRQEWGGGDLIGRAGRITILLTGLLAAGLTERVFGRGADDKGVILAVVVLVAVLANATVLQRMVKARRVLRRIDREG